MRTSIHFVLVSMCCATTAVAQFSPHREVTHELLPQASSVASADMDGDGDIDLVGAGGPDIVVFENTDGAGTFEAKVAVAMDIIESAIKC